MSNRYFKIFVVVIGDNCKTPAETFCPGDGKVLEYFEISKDI